MKHKTINIKLLGSNVKKFRIEKKLTQEKLAALTGLSTQYIGNIERGNTTTSIDTLIKICNILDITPNDLLISTYSTAPNALINTIIDSLNNTSPEFINHIYRYIQFMKKDNSI